ncbi:hypothetical protein D9758_000946 [Tetrapyrgos nigripes]|uniref:DUF1446-domain-containing protein n=1 Tax=Tetrapyrgos nigripes TaxID=182062 RepID=A0A8H5GZ19_9AGAR|nr:hypothetical protein D9758_000946 [Tetrapyrgos nigripes]
MFLSDSVTWVNRDPMIYTPDALDDPRKMVSTKRAVRIANCSGAVGDGYHQIYRQATEGPVDAIFGDYLSEMNIAWRALEMKDNSALGYEPFFLTQLQYKNTLEIVARKGIKLITDAGAFNPYGLYRETKKLLEEKGLSDVKMAWVEGDNVGQEVVAHAKDVGRFPHLDIPDEDLSKVKTEILSANAYIGVGGVIAALEAGAQIIICGRICDATAVMAVCSWWHGWSEIEYDKLAHTLVAGHIIECGAYATGGNFCGFQSFNLIDPGFPIAEVSADGTFVVTMHEGCTGAVTVDTVTAQLVYEIQGPIYLNPDVSANLEEIRLKDVGRNRVHVSGVKGSPPPPTMKLAVQTFGGYQGELSFYATGIDVEAKYTSMKEKILGTLDKSRFIKIAIDKYGTPEPNPRSLKTASVQIRLFLQASTPEPILELQKYTCWWFMSDFGGCFLNMDTRTLIPKPFTTFFPGKIEQGAVHVRAHIGDHVVEVSSVSKTAPFHGQKSYGPKAVTALSSFGPTRKAPLGSIVLARSGDKGANSNIGMWVRHDDEWPWLQSFLTTEMFQKLLRDDWKLEYRVERFEMEHIRAVHFLCYGLLEEGTSSSSLLDSLGKAVGELLRAQVVEVPVKFLERPWVGSRQAYF